MIASHERHMDDVLRARLHLAGDAKLRLGLLRGAIGAADGASRLLFGKPFFALRESEALLSRLAEVPKEELVATVLGLDGGTTIVPHGLEHVPPTGPVVIASTHPTGMFDFVAHAAALGAVRRDLRVVANQEAAAFLGPDMIVPVRIDRENRAISTKPVFAAMQAHLGQGGALLIFGSGRVPHRRNGRLVEPAWRSGATRISELTGAPVIPAAPDARNSRYYYRLRSAAQALGGGDDNIGAMVASLRYAAELLEKLGGRYDIHYGPALPPGTSPEALKVAAEGLVPGLYNS